MRGHRRLALGTRGGSPCRAACVAVTHTYPAADLVGAADLVVDALSDLTVSRIEDLLRDNRAAR